MCKQIESPQPKTIYATLWINKMAYRCQLPDTDESWDWLMYPSVKIISCFFVYHSPWQLISWRLNAKELRELTGYVLTRLLPRQDKLITTVDRLREIATKQEQST